MGIIQMKRFACVSVSALGLAMALGGAANAQDRLTQYVRGSAGVSLLGDSDNSGAFTNDFTLGLEAGTVPSGSSLGWTTEFDTGGFVSGAYGVALPNGLRFEGEVSWSTNDVDSHSGVTVGGLGNIDTIDAGVLLGAAQTTPLELTVGGLVADGQGSVETLGFTANAFYDFDIPNSRFGGYAGLGLGVAQVDIDYSPSAVAIINDDETVFLYQIMFGGEFALNEQVNLFTGYRYRATQDVEVDVSLFPATLEIENASNIIEAGVRFTF